ncbi:MAG: hypothetical protein K6E83_02405 [Clostridium sp.]|nr:hypothetical protein [Clostridium sp.]
MKYKKITLVILFLALLFLPYPSWRVMRGRLNTENNENRVLAERPVLSRGTLESFPEAFSAYVNDRMPFRTQLIRTQSRLDYYLFRRSFDDQVVLGRDNFLFHQAEKPFHRGNGGFSEEQLEKIAGNLAEAQKNLAAEGTEFYLFIAPNKETIYPENFPPEIVRTGEMNRTEQLIAYLREHTDVPVIFPKEELLEAKRRLPEFRLYRSSDTHWNQLGAYVATRVLLARLGITLPDYADENLLRVGLDDDPGDLAKMIYLENDIDLGQAYMIGGFETWNMQNPVSDFWGNLEFASDSPDRRKLFVCRDSFGVAMGDILGTQFAETVMPHVTEAYQPEQVRRMHPDIFVYEVVERFSYYLEDFYYGP